MRDDERGALIPREFWRVLGSAGMMKLFEQGGFLNAEQCALLWKIEGRKGKPPKRLEVLFSAEDIMREFPPFTKH